VLCNWGLRYWEDVKTCLREAPETCQEALYDLSYFYRHGDADKLSSLEPWQLAELYVWLRNYRYQKKGTVSTEANSMEDYAYLTLDNYMINRLVKTATSDSINALKYIQKHLLDEDKEFFKYYLNRAKEEQQRKHWQIYTPQEVMRFPEKKGRRKFILKLVILVIVLCVANIAYYLALQYFDADELVSKVWGAYWPPWVLVNGVILCLWYFWLAKDEKNAFREIKNRFAGWRS